MGSLDKLKAVVGALFEKANDKESIEKLASVNSCIDDLEKEMNDLTDKNAELVKSYKELVKHTSFDEAPKPDNTNSGTVPAETLEDALTKFLASKQKEK